MLYMTGTQPLLLSSRCVYRSTRSDPSATKGGPGGVANVTSKALEPIAIRELIADLTQRGVRTIHYCVADGDSTTHDDIQKAFPGVKLVLCQNHGLKAVKKMLNQREPKQDSKTRLVSKTRLGAAAASTIPQNVAEVEARIAAATNLVGTTAIIDDESEASEADALPEEFLKAVNDNSKRHLQTLTDQAVDNGRVHRAIAGADAIVPEDPAFSRAVRAISNQGEGEGVSGGPRADEAEDEADCEPEQRVRRVPCACKATCNKRCPCHDATLTLIQKNRLM